MYQFGVNIRFKTENVLYLNIIFYRFIKLYESQSKLFIYLFIYLVIYFIFVALD